MSNNAERTPKVIHRAASFAHGDIRAQWVAPSLMEIRDLRFPEQAPVLVDSDEAKALRDWLNGSNL